MLAAFWWECIFHEAEAGAVHYLCTRYGFITAKRKILWFHYFTLVFCNYAVKGILRFKYFLGSKECFEGLLNTHAMRGTWWWHRHGCPGRLVSRSGGAWTSSSPCRPPSCQAPVAPPDMRMDMDKGIQSKPLWSSTLQNIYLISDDMIYILYRICKQPYRVTFVHFMTLIVF